jgi:hypothetical protein
LTARLVALRWGLALDGELAGERKVHASRWDRTWNWSDETQSEGKEIEDGDQDQRSSGDHDNGDGGVHVRAGGGGKVKEKDFHAVFPEGEFVCLMEGDVKVSGDGD